MSLAYSINRVIIDKVVGFEAQEVQVGSTWKSGNILFRTNENGSSAQPKKKKWARALDEHGRTYLLWKTDDDRVNVNGLVIQPVDSEYCFEVFPD